MDESKQVESEQIAGERLRIWLDGDDGSQVAILSALVDAHLLFQEECLSPELLRPLFEARWPDASFADASERACRYGVVERGPGGALAVPEASRRPLAAALEQHVLDQVIHRFGGTISFRRLMAGFIDHCVTDLRLSPGDGAAVGLWGGVAFRLSARWQLLLIRPDMLMLRAHPEAYTLTLCSLAAPVARITAASFVQEPALRNRAALFDVESGEKANLTRGELPVYFERYLRAAHGQRMSPSTVLTDGLRDGALLNLDKG